MKIEARDVFALLTKAAGKANLEIRDRDFDTLAHVMRTGLKQREEFRVRAGEISDFFVRVKMFRNYKYFVSGKTKNYRAPAERTLDLAAIYCGFDSYRDFYSELHKAVTASLKDCEGHWLSYVRCNSGRDELLVSPVRIWEENYKMMIELTGPARKFKGELLHKGQNFCALLDTGKDKQLHLIFRIGFAQNPHVLQGVFSGMSSGGDPIAGKEVLVRQRAPGKPKKLKLEMLRASKKKEERILAGFFKEFDGTNLKISNVATFTFEDLEAREVKKQPGRSGRKTPRRQRNLNQL